MSRAELKTEIEKLLDDAPENALIEALSILKDGSAQCDEKEKRMAHIKLILKEDKTLLNRLAQ